MRYLNLLLSATVITVASAFTSGSHLTISSNGIPNGNLSAKYSCDGAGINPPLLVTDIPAAARSLAVIAQDPDAPVAGGFTHWVAWNLSTDGVIQEGMTGGDQGTNGAGHVGFAAACPPVGSGDHHYHFTVYALDTRLTLPASTDKAALEHAMEGHIVGTGELVGVFAKTE